MNKLEKQIRDCLESLEKTVNNFVSFFKNDKDFNQMVYTYWTVKDVLGHVTFWDESRGKLADVNKMSVDTTRKVPVCCSLPKTD